MLNKNASLKYETTYKGTFEIIQCWTNGTVTLQYCATKIRYNIHHIIPYTYYTNVEVIIAKNQCDDVRFKYTSYILL